jgi:hypothetical protein
MNLTITGWDWLWLVLLYVVGDIGYHLAGFAWHRFQRRQAIRKAARESDQAARDSVVGAGQFPDDYWQQVDGNPHGRFKHPE